MYKHQTSENHQNDKNQYISLNILYLIYIKYILYITLTVSSINFPSKASFIRLDLRKRIEQLFLQEAHFSIKDKLTSQNKQMKKKNSKQMKQMNSQMTLFYYNIEQTNFRLKLDLKRKIFHNGLRENHQKNVLILKQYTLNLIASNLKKNTVYKIHINRTQ